MFKLLYPMYELYKLLKRYNKTSSGRYKGQALADMTESSKAVTVVCQSMTMFNPTMGKFSSSFILIHFELFD